MLGSVGSSSGSVHKQRQGTGLATILEGDRALDTYDGLAALDRAKMARKQAELDAARDRMLKFNPDRWFKHENTVNTALNGWVEEGAKIMADNEVDPYTSTDERSVNWRKKQNEIAGLGMASTQLQDAYTKLRAKIDGADPGKYTPASLNDLADYFGRDVEDIIASGEMPPALMQTKPFLNVQEHISKVMGAINPTLNGNTMTDVDRWGIVKETLANPAVADDLNESLANMFQQMRPEEQLDLNRRAIAAGKSVQEQATFDFVMRYETQRKAFNYDTWKKSLVDRVTVPYKKWDGADSFSKKVDEAEIAKNIGTIARDAFVGDERALQEYEAVLPRTPGITDQVYRDQAEKHLAKQIRNEIATQEEAGVTVRGQDKKDLQVSQKTWLPDIMSKDPDKYREAAGYITGLKGVMGNMTVMDSRVMQGTPYPDFRLTLKGNLDLKDIEKELPGGLGEFITETVQRGTDTEIFIPITPQTENYLLTFHDLKLKQTGIGYGGTFTQTPATKISGMAPNMPAPTNLINAPVVEPFKFKPKQK